ncbi:hypothetical protein HDU84_001764 [Entophlyctis sp. JEL0112]|nr:hypothetical protein HDU84_001764 [Entophlyctis sp. JEL0112]
MEPVPAEALSVGVDAGFAVPSPAVFLAAVDKCVRVPLPTSTVPSTVLADCPRYITGRLRVAAHLLPAEPILIRLHFFGISNGLRDSDSGSPSVPGSQAAPDTIERRAPVPVNLTLIVWQVGDSADLAPGVHEFPFSLQIPSNILPTYNLLLSSMPFSHQFDSSLPCLEQRQLRSYELAASVVCADNSFVLSNDQCPILVQQCFPRWLAGDERIGRGVTAGGEFNASISIPRFVFLQDGEIAIGVSIVDGTETVRSITSVRCYLVETAAYKVPSQHIPIPVPIGTLFRYKVPNHLHASTMEKYPLFSPQNPLRINLKLADARVDLSTDLLQLTHSLVFEFVYKIGSSSVSGGRGSKNGGAASGSSHAYSSGASTNTSVVVDPLRTIQMIHEALEKRSEMTSTLSGVDSPTVTGGTPLSAGGTSTILSSGSGSSSSRPQRLKASLIVPVRIVNEAPVEDTGLMNAFGNVPAPPIAAGLSNQLETPLTVRVGYEPTLEHDGIHEPKDLADQLRMTPGDQVIIEDTFGDGWAVGTNLTTGMAGLFPVTLVKFIPTSAIFPTPNGPNVPVPSTAAQRVPLPPSPLQLPPMTIPYLSDPPLRHSHQHHERNNHAGSVEAKVILASRTGMNINKDLEKQKLKEQLEQMQEMMLALKAKLDAL